jgi:hypothetical protein
MIDEYTLNKLNNDLKNKKMRKAVTADFFTSVKKPKNNKSIKFDKPKDYRLQVEYGEKKFIKP